MAHRFDKLQPTAIMSTIGSLPRRFNGTFTPTPTAEPNDVAQLVGDDGRSMLDILATVTKMLTETRHEMSAAANRDNATVARKAIEPASIGHAKASGDLDAEMAKLEEATEKLSDTMNVMSVTDWGRVAQVEGGGDATVQRIGQCIAEVAIGELDIADALGKTF